MATYRIGPSDFFTPSDLQADADTLNSQVDALESVYQTNVGSPSSDLMDSWARFTAQWSPFYVDKFGGGFLGDLTTALNNSNRDQLIQFENRFESLKAELRDAGVQSVGADQVTPKPDTSVSSVLKWASLVLGLILVLYLVFKVA